MGKEYVHDSLDHTFVPALASRGTKLNGYVQHGLEEKLQVIARSTRKTLGWGGEGEQT